MKWQGRRESTNVEDRRGFPVKGAAIGGGIGGGILILVITLILNFCSGGDLSQTLNTLQPDNQAVVTTYQETQDERDLAQFVSVVLAETEDVWTEIFSGNNQTYTYPTLVLYTDYVESACGMAGSATGPFYCPEDQKVYIDLSFYKELQDRFKAPGDFAMAYVISHEVGHHVQNLLGIMDEVNSITQNLSEAESNQYSVRLELQADYLAGVWGHYVNRMNLLEQGDLEEALNAASSVGDDRIQKEAQGYIVPDSFTHGTSEQRQRWFYKGFISGTLEDGDTFNTDNL
ncbi:MAG TPA: neutral zinc metallopeptidase [Clostridia bacterium]|nr:neutral zinc metallopeptidase [Clostridia bacterium]